MKFRIRFCGQLQCGLKVSCYVYQYTADSVVEPELIIRIVFFDFQCIAAQACAQRHMLPGAVLHTIGCVGVAAGPIVELHHKRLGVQIPAKFWCHIIVKH